MINNVENNDRCNYSFPRILNANVRALSNKIDELYTVLATLLIDIAIVTETRCHENIPDSALHFIGYLIFHNDRGGKRGGGVMILVKNHVRFSENIPELALKHCGYLYPHGKCLV